MSRNGRVCLKRQAYFLQANVGFANWLVVGVAQRQKTIDQEGLDLFSIDFNANRSTDQFGAASKNRNGLDFIAFISC